MKNQLRGSLFRECVFRPLLLLLVLLLLLLLLPPKSKLLVHLNFSSDDIPFLFLHLKERKKIFRTQKNPASEKLRSSNYGRFEF